MSDEPKQLKLTPVPESEFKPKKGKKDLPAGRQGKEEKANKWVVVAVLVISVLVSLIFYFSGGKRTQEPTQTPSKSGGGLFGPKVYQF